MENCKEELLESLKRYKRILASSMLEYLSSLLELEFSVVQEFIGEEDREILSDLEIYNKIAIYNIYNRALILFRKKEIEYLISDNIMSQSRKSNVLVPLDDNHSVKVFAFDYPISGSKGFGRRKIFDVGTISLYQLLESPELREEELNRVMSKLERLYNARNPYSFRRHRSGGPGVQWAFDHAREINTYEKRFIELDERKELSDGEKRKVEMTNQVSNILLEDYGLANNSFEEVKSLDDHSALSKTLVKRQPNLTIFRNIEYI